MLFRECDLNWRKVVKEKYSRNSLYPTALTTSKMFRHRKLIRKNNVFIYVCVDSGNNLDEVLVHSI